MRVTNFCLGALVVSLLGLGTVHGQSGAPSYGQGSQQVPYGLGGPTLTPETAQGAGGGGDLRAPVGLSRWIMGAHPPGCCGPTGGQPILSELYIRSGYTKPFGNGQVAQSLDSGWAFEAGARLLFPTGCGSSAWTVDASYTSMSNNGSNAPIEFITIIPPVAAGGDSIFAVTSLRSLHRSYVNLAVGREFYLRGEATQGNSDELRWRVGADVGGRYGTEKMHYNQPFLTHATDLSYGVFASVHSDIEVPYPSFDLIIGLRGVYDYTWSEIAGGNNDGDIQDAMIMATLGFRF